MSLPDYQWFNFSVDRSVQVNHIKYSKGPLIINFIISLCIAGIFYWVGWSVMTIVVISVGSSITLIGLCAPKLFQKINTLFVQLGHGLSVILTHLLFLPFLWVVFPILRLQAFFFEEDRMQKTRNQSSYWFLRTEISEVSQVVVPYSQEPFGKKSSLLKLIILQMMVIIFVLVVGEGLLRFYGYGTPILYINPPQIGYMPQPNQEVSRRGNKIFINSFGMRSDEVSKAKPSNVYRVFMIGDSTLYAGSYIDQHEMFSERFKNLMNQNLKKLTSSPSKVEVLTMAANAWGPRHKLGYLQKYGFFEADHFIVVLPVHDIYRPKYSIAGLPYFHSKRPPKLAWEEVINHLTWRLRGEYTGGYDIDDTFKINGMKTYLQIAELAKQSVPRVSFLIIPPSVAVMSNQYNDVEFERFKRLIEGAGFEIFVPLTALHQKSKHPLLYHDEVHLDKMGHHVLASALIKKFYDISP